MKNNKILITGAGGFIGSHVVEKALKLNYKVTAFVKYNSSNDWGWINSINHKNLNIVAGDVTDVEFVNEIVKGQDYVFHLAALIGIPYSYKAVNTYFQTNLNGTINMLNACKRFGIKRLLVTSTSEVYGTALYTPIDEKHPLQAQSPYSASKIAADQISIAFIKSFETPVTIVRPFNAYGPRQSERAIIPTIISQIITKKKFIEIGNPDPTRDYNYVEDIADAFFKIANSKKTKNEIINVCTGKEIQIKKLAEKILQIANVKKKIITKTNRLRPKNSEVERLLGDNSKILKLTDWKNSTGLRKGLTKTINWFKENYKNKKLKFKSHIYNI
tara:strand:- start:209 stop:1198 length:990 start_codon:yes stop_codon:yes gene_type:complete